MSNDTPRTDAEDINRVFHNPHAAYYKMRSFAEQIERELAAVTEQRDNLHALHNRNAEHHAELLALSVSLRKERDLANVVLACLCDMVLGEDAKDASNDALMHGVRRLLNERDSAIKDLRETHNAYLEEMHGVSIRASQYKEERDEANSEAEKYRIGWGKCYDQLNEAQAALREAIKFAEPHMLEDDALSTKTPHYPYYKHYYPMLQRWSKAARMEDAQ